MEYKIKKAKITRTRTLEVDLVERIGDGTENEVTKKCSQLVHPDLGNAFDRLRFHLAKLCDLKEGDKVSSIMNYNMEDLSNISVSSFSLSGFDSSEGVSLVGQKRIGHKVLNLCAPFQKFEDEQAEYTYGSDLAADIEACKYEVEQYLFHEKYAIKPLKLEFGDQELDPDGGEMNQEATLVTTSVLEHLGESILEEGKGKRKRMKLQEQHSEAI
jgi:hypothetical protein